MSQQEDRTPKVPAERKTRVAIGRYLAIFASILALVILWRLFSPWSLPRLAERMSDDAVRLWSQPYFSIGSVGVTPVLLLKFFLFLVVLIYASRGLAFVIRRRGLDYLPLDEGQKFAIERFFAYSVFVIGLIIGLQSLGVELGSLVVVGGALGIGIGLGLQSIAKNFASGLILLLERPVKVGDRVEVGELLGDVIHIGGRGTWIRTNENVVIIIPNSEFIENRVVNWTANDRRVRIAVPLGVSYGSDPEHVRRVLLEVARKHPDVENQPEPVVIFRGFGDSSLNFELWIWTMKQVTTPKIISSDLYYAVFRAFREAGIEIPFPQRDLHLRSVGLRIPVDTGASESP